VSSIPGYYRKKPVIVGASQWFKHGDHPKVVPLPPEHPIDRHAIAPNEYGWIETLEGGHVVSPGDWIIRGVKGEHYPCKPDIFAETYEEVQI
jgi:hypothetical protein